MSSPRCVFASALLSCLLAVGTTTSSMGVAQNRSEAPRRLRSSTEEISRVSAALSLLPLPANVTRREGRLVLEPSLGIAIEGHTDARLERALDRFVARLAERTGWILPPRTRIPASGEPTFVIAARSAGPEWPTLGEEESYSLDIDASRARIEAPTTTGVLRALATLEQLIALDARGFFLPAVAIEDAPRFPWRGLLIDICRHWQPPEVILRNLDAMAAVKLNVLHLHLTEDQAFRLESRAYPKLHELGSEGRYYTRGDLRRIVEAARDRGIRVVPEIDVPGHTTSWLVAYPELSGSDRTFALADTWGIKDAALDPTRDHTYRFLDRLLGEVATLFPDPYLHIGGDEVTAELWQETPHIRAFMEQRGWDMHALQAHFNKRLSAIVTAHERTLIGWDEVLHPELPHDSVVQSWRGAESLVAAARAGHPAILSSGYYLDHMRSAAFHYRVDPHDGTGALDEKQRARILGGEACMWGEFVTPETIDSRIWPRLGAIAERLWSPRDVTDEESLYRRLATLSLQLDGIGLRHRSAYEPMLRRLAGHGDIAPLRLLADLVEPVKLYARTRARPYTTKTPLNRLVDAARPESMAARRLDAAVASLLEQEVPATELTTVFAEWTRNHERLLPTLRASALLHEIEPLSERLAELGRIGLEALDALAGAEAGTARWRLETLERLERLAEPHAELELVAVRPVRRLVEQTGRP